MTCEQTIEKISPFIRRELSGENRVQILNHLRQCPACREDYLNNLKLFYELDKQQVYADRAQTDGNVFMDQIKEKIRIEKKPEWHLKRWLTMAAALLILSSLFLGRYFYTLQNYQMASLAKQSNDLQQLLKNEDWPTILTVLNDSGQINSQANKPIPVELLVEKLLVLNKQGFHFIELGNFSALAAPEASIPGQSTSTARGDIQLSMRKIIKNLQYYKRQKSHITLLEITSLINNPSIRRIQT